jgi:hypothetical protein
MSYQTTIEDALELVETLPEFNFDAVAEENLYLFTREALIRQIATSIKMVEAFESLEQAILEDGVLEATVVDDEAP